MRDSSYEKIHELIVAEQDCQKGEFIDVDLESYIDKLFDKAEFVVNHDKHHCLGFVAYYTYEKRMKTVFISLVLVAPAARRKGLAHSLIGFVLKSAKRRGFTKCSLVVKKSNFSAIRLYQSLGFVIEDEQDGKYWLVHVFNAEKGGSTMPAV